MENAVCRQCQNFVQHYGLSNKCLYRIYCGHCTLGRTKTKRPDTKACSQFVPGVMDTERFASKEYISKYLLDYMASLELLPIIKDAETITKAKTERE